MRTFIALILTSITASADWPQFHGPAGNGSAAGKLPENWGDSANMAWKAELPGLGSSSPVIMGNKLFITSAVGGAEDLVRHVLCLDATTGAILWDKTVKSELPEQERIREDHGYASATPVATATRLFVFFGKSGVFCFDHAGRELWNTKVGAGLNGWGSAASLTMHKNLVLVNASVESGSLVALDQASGREVWRAGGIKECWHAPVVAPGAGGKAEVIMALIGELRSFDADSGAPLWHCKSGITWYMCPQPVVKDGVVYAVGGRSGTGGLAVRLGGSGEVSDSHRLWTLPAGTNVPSPVVHEGHMYFVNDSKATANCVNLKTGDLVYSERITPPLMQAYASPILADGKILYVGRGGQAAIVPAQPKFGVLSAPVLENNRGVFNASPVLDGGKLYLRSKKFLYCIAAK